MGPPAECAACKQTATLSAAGFDADSTSDLSAYDAAYDAPSTGLDTRETTGYDASCSGAFDGHDALPTGVIGSAKNAI